MAIDELLMSDPSPVLRFYGWENPTLSFGRNHMKLNSIDRQYCAQNKIELVRRITGGRTVLHHHEITYTFSVDARLFPQGVLAAYKLVSQALLEGLETLGIHAAMTPSKKQGTSSTICFEESSAYELVADTRKLVGSAQYRTKNRILQHGSILLDIDWNLWKRIWNISPGSIPLQQRVTSIKEQLGNIPPRQSFVTAISQSFSRFFQAPLREMELDSWNWNEVNDLAANKYLIRNELQESIYHKERCSGVPPL